MRIDKVKESLKLVSFKDKIADNTSDGRLLDLIQQEPVLKDAVEELDLELMD